MRAAVLVAERNRRQGAAAEANLRRLDFLRLRVNPVATDLLMIDQLDCGAGCEASEIVAVGKGILERLDNRRWNPVLRGGAAEAVLNRERQIDRLSDVLNRLYGRLDNPG